ncbi:MAG: alpha/beta hydrolase [Microbacteriaceae bacterium]
MSPGIRRALAGVLLGPLLLGLALAGGGCSLLGTLAGTATSTPDPSGAPAGAESLYSQTIVWRSCEQSMQCATVSAPLDWSDPGGETIQLALIRAPATGESQGTLFVNPGGPGGSGVDFLADGADAAVDTELARHFDIVSWDPRGVGSSSAVSCGTAAELDDFYFGIVPGDAGSADWWSQDLADAAAFAARCAEGTGALLAHVDTLSTVRDLDMLRALVGDASLNYLGYSYGTFLGAEYAETFPGRVGRMVLDGAVDPSLDYAESAAVQAAGFESALRAYLTDCLGRSDCPLAGSGSDAGSDAVEAAMADIRDTLARLDASPLVASDGRELGGATMATAIITPLYSEANWPYLDALFQSVARGSAEMALSLADSYYGRDSAGDYASNLIEAFFAIGCLDSGAVEDTAQLDVDEAAVEAAAPYLGRWLGPYSGHGYSGTACAVWPYPAVIQAGPITAAGSPDIVVVGTTNDPATPYAAAQALAAELENGHLVTYDGEGHTAYNGSSECVDATVDAYFVDGTVPASDPLC